MTKKYFVLFAAVSMAATTALAQQQTQTQPRLGTQAASHQPQQSTASTTADPSAATGSTAAAGQQASPYADDIRRVLARVTSDAVKGNVKNVAESFTTASQDNFSRRGSHTAGGRTAAANAAPGASAATGADATVTTPGAAASTSDATGQPDVKTADDQLHNTSRQFTDAWKAKYNHDFSIDRKNEAVVYGGQTFQILKGDMANSAQQPQAASAQVGASGAGLDANANTNTNAANAHNTPDTTRNPGLTGHISGRSGAANGAEVENRMATVTAQESHGAPTLNLTMVNEGTFGNRWHIQPPAGLDYRTLSSNLNKHLQEVLQMKDQWPQDENQAYTMVSHHVLAAIAEPMTDAQRAAGQQQSQSDTNAAQPAGYQSGTTVQHQQSTPRYPAAGQTTPGTQTPSR